MVKQNSSSSSSGVGNNKQSTPLKHWFLTWNNYLEQDWINLSSIVPQKCEKWTFQEERGQMGTPHIQGTFTFKQKIRVETLLKLFPGSFWQKNKCSSSHNYCSKPSFQGARKCTSEIQIEVYRPTHPIFDEIEQMTKEKSDHRTIHWFWESKGNIGKSAFCKYMYITYETKIITTPKSADIVTAIEATDKTIIFDFPRCSNPGTFCPYTAIEQIKNGFITDAKLKKKARIIVMNSPHVIIFANEPPDTSKLSEDRWNIREIIHKD